MTDIGNFLQKELIQALPKDQVTIRGRGLMIGIDLHMPCKQLIMHALAQGILVNVASEQVVRLLPPLVYTHEHAEQLLSKLVPIINTFLQQSSSIEDI